MAQTKLMRADEIAQGFNAVAADTYWRAIVAGTRINPEVHFNSRSSMVRVCYRIGDDSFTVTFHKADTSFGDFLASVYRSTSQVLTRLKAAGLPFYMPLEASAMLRIEYDPRTKEATVHLALHGDDWQDAEPLPFKVPERNNSEISPPAIDGL